MSGMPEAALGMQQGHPRHLQGNQSGQLGLGGAVGAPSQSMPNAGHVFLESFAKIQTSYYFRDLLLLFWVAGQSIFFLNKGQVNRAWS